MWPEGIWHRTLSRTSLRTSSKMAYSDYLDRLPQNQRAAADKFRPPLEGDKFYWDYDKEKKQWVRTPVPVGAKKVDYAPTGGSGGGNYFFTGLDANGNPIQYVAPKKGPPNAQPVKTPEGETVPVAEPVRKLEADRAKFSESDAKELEEISQLFNGKLKDKQGNKLSYTPAHIARFNQLSKDSFAFEHSEPSKIYSGLAPTKTVVQVPRQDLNVMYKFFTEQGGKGTIEQFTSNPDIIDRVYTAMGAKK